MNTVKKLKEFDHYMGALVHLHLHNSKKPKQNVEKEKFIYVGCIHGGDESIYARLKEIIKEKPDYVIFAGDITGSPEIEKLKHRFYENKKENKELLSFEYFGDWAATLPIEKRKELLSSVKPAVARIYEIISRMQKSGITIYLLEGNWDNPEISGLNAIAGKDIPSFFKTKEFFKSCGFPFIDRLHTLETDSSFHIFLPYHTLLHFDDVSGDHLKQIRGKINEIRKEKKIILVGHAEANWKMHHLDENHPVPTGERKEIIGNFVKAIRLLLPDEVIYPHQHARIRDENGNLLGLNEKYFLHVTKNGVKLVEEKGESTPEDTVVTYVPMGYVAEEEFK